MKKHFYLLALLSLVYCSKEVKNSSQVTATDSLMLNAEDSIANESNQIEKEDLNRAQTLETLNNEVISTLKTKDFVKFSKYIHPEKGIRFSMYGYVQPKQDKHFTRGEFIKYVPTNIKFTWGEKDGTGDKLVLPIKDYLTKWVFKKDFKGAEYHENVFKGSGNSINNLKEIYPKADFTENYIPGSEEYGEMDWKSLRFVFEELYGTKYLVAVINDEWTV